jgi:protein O-mannosyl-transferase
LNYWFGKLDPRGYRLINIGLHATSAILLWLIVRRTLRLDFFHDKFAHVAAPLSFACALVWALHPLNTESVVYVTQRTELMMGFLYLATIYSCLRYWEAGRPVKRRTWLTVAVMASLLGMLSKESMATAPLMVLLYDRTFVSGSFPRAWRESWPLYVGLMLTWILLAVLNLSGPRTPMVGFGLGVSAWAWWLTQAKVLFIYLKLAIWPWPLLIHYEMPYLETISQAWPWIVGAAMLAVATMLLLWRRSAAGFAGAWLLVVLSPTMAIPLVSSVAAERRMYVPLMAIVCLGVAGGYVLLAACLRLLSSRRPQLSTWRAGGIAIAAALSLATVFGLVSVRRLAMYGDELTLWMDAEKYEPDSTMVQTNIGTALDNAGRHEEALVRFEKLAHEHPDVLLAHYNLARLLEDANRLPEAQEHAAIVVRLRPDLGSGHYTLGHLLERAGETQRAQQEYEEALRLFPNFPMAHYALGCLLEKEGDTPAARSHFEDAIRLYPQFPSAHRNLALLLSRNNQVQQAIPHFEQVLRLARSADAYANLARAYAQAQRPTEAIGTAQAAVEAARMGGRIDEAQRIQQWLTAYRQALAEAYGKAAQNPAVGAGQPQSSTTPATP